MRNFSIITLLFILVLSACGKPNTVSLKLPANVPLVAWKADNSHIKQLKGSITVNGEGVSGVLFQIGNALVKSDQSGQFSFTIDSSKISRTEVAIVNVTNARANGKALTNDEKALLQNRKTFISVEYPIKIESTKEEKNNVIVLGSALAENNQFPTIQTRKYVITGMVKDFQGNPVQGAIVSTTNDSGQGWAKSSPSDKNGRYLIALTPDNGEDSTFRVSVGRTQYALPPDKVFRFPDHSSDEIDIILPEKGTIIEDKPPTLVAKQISGSMNEGIIVGLEGVDPKNYRITVPEPNGQFLLTVPKSIWEKHPHFFEKKINQYYNRNLTSKDLVPKEWLQP